MDYRFTLLLAILIYLIQTTSEDNFETDNFERTTLKDDNKIVKTEIFETTTFAADNESATIKPLEKNKYRACIFDGIVFGHEDRIDVKEPCLNCSCNKGLLSCYRKACPPLAIRPECWFQKLPNICCPIIACGGTEDELSDPETSTDIYQVFGNSTDYVVEEQNNSKIGVFDESITDFREDLENLDVSTPLEAVATTVNPFEESIDKNIIRESRKQNEDLVLVSERYVDLPQKLPDKACFYGGSIYSEGSAMESGTSCQNCFCLGGNRRCMQTKCNLRIPGCIPKYDDNNSCCPKSYNCTGITEVPLTTTSTTQLPPVTKCWIGDMTYSVGDRIYTPNACKICYCILSGMECDKIICDPPEDQSCTPVMEEGECCPISYNCSEPYQNISGMEYQKESSVRPELEENYYGYIEAFDENRDNNTTFQNESLNNTSPDDDETMSASMLSAIIFDVKNNLNQLIKEVSGAKTLDQDDIKQSKNETILHNAVNGRFEGSTNELGTQNTDSSFLEQNLERDRQGDHGQNEIKLQNLVNDNAEGGNSILAAQEQVPISANTNYSTGIEENLNRDGHGADQEQIESDTQNLVADNLLERNANDTIGKERAPNSDIPNMLNTTVAENILDQTGQDVGSQFHDLAAKNQASNSDTISLNNGDVNDTVMALLLEHVFGSNKVNERIYANILNGTDLSEGKNTTKPHVTNSSLFNDETTNGERNQDNTKKHGSTGNEIVFETEPTFLPSSVFGDTQEKNTVKPTFLTPSILGDTQEENTRKPTFLTPSILGGTQEENTRKPTFLTPSILGGTQEENTRKPIFLTPSILGDTKEEITGNPTLTPSILRDTQEVNTVVGNSIRPKEQDDVFSTTVVQNLYKTRIPGDSQQFQPQFIDSAALVGIKYTAEKNDGFSDRVLEDSKPFRENDRLINVLNIEQVLKRQLDLRKIPPHLLSKVKSPPRKPYYEKKHKKPLYKDKPPEMFGPPPTLPPKLVASLMSMLKPAPFVNSRVNRGEFSVLQKGSGTEGTTESGIELKDPSKAKADIKFIPFVAADALGNSKGKVKVEPSADAIVEYISDKAHQCTVGDKKFENGDSVPRANPCIACLCLYGQVLCKKEQCSPTPPGCTSITMEGDCCPVHSCGEGLVQVVNNENFQKDTDEPAIEDHHGEEQNTTNEIIENYGSVFEIINRNNASKPIKNPFKSDSTKFDSSVTTSSTSTKAPGQKTVEETIKATMAKIGVGPTQKPINIEGPTKVIEKHLNIPQESDENDQGTYVASVDVVPISKGTPSADPQTGSSSNNKQVYSVGSVLRFGADDNQEIIEDDGILTFANEPNFDPYDVLSDLFVPEDNNKQATDNEVIKEWSSPVQDGGSFQKQHGAATEGTAKIEVPEAATKRTTVKPTTSTRRKTTTRRPKTTRTPKPTSTVMFTKPTQSTSTRPKTTRSTTTRAPTKKSVIDIAKPTKAGHFVDPWGLLKLSGCSYKGKTFMIGAEIPELGNRCRKCNCLSLGVVCQELDNDC